MAAAARVAAARRTRVEVVIDTEAPVGRWHGDVPDGECVRPTLAADSTKLQALTE
jgi:hypothetical protein